MQIKFYNKTISLNYKTDNHEQDNLIAFGDPRTNLNFGGSFYKLTSFTYFSINTSVEVHKHLAVIKWNLFMFRFHSHQPTTKLPPTI